MSEPTNGEPMTLDKLAQMIENHLPKKEDLALLATKRRSGRVYDKGRFSAYGQ